MRIVIGAIVLLFGVIVFGHAIITLPVGVSSAFIFGNLLPSGLVITLGIVILAWRKKRGDAK